MSYCMVEAYISSVFDSALDVDNKLLSIPVFDDDGLLFDTSYDDGDELPGIIVEGYDDDE